MSYVRLSPSFRPEVERAILGWRLNMASSPTWAGGLPSMSAMKRSLIDLVMPSDAS
jgi:hypothetical protein